MAQLRLAAITLLLAYAPAAAGEVEIRVDAAKTTRPFPRFLTGSCIEDVNHEIYGGLYSQMVFGESFQEPPPSAVIKGFRVVEGEWRVKGSELFGDGGPGHKLLARNEPSASGEVGVDVFLEGMAGGPCGLILQVNDAKPGADAWDGYEVTIDVAKKTLLLGRHRHDFQALREVPCDVAPDRWIALSAEWQGGRIRASVDGKQVLDHTDPRPLKPGAVGLRQWMRPARYRNLWVRAGSDRSSLPFEAEAERPAVSRMWGPVARGTAVLQAAVETDAPFAGERSQRVTFAGGSGEAGVENQGLNRRGMAFAKGKPYEGYLWVRAKTFVDVFASLESRDGLRRYAETRLAVPGGDGWTRLDFTLTPDASETAGRFAVALRSPGSVVLGHAFLHPGEWGRFKGLPVRRDVVEGLVGQGVQVLRYGGSMVNVPAYRWKKMVGPRDRRPPYRGMWYPYATNGWGIVDFLDVCDAAGIVGIPAFNMDETPQDMADFVEYVNGAPDTPWGRRRAEAGRREPYRLRHLQLGNEERVDETYVRKFAALAEAVWAKDPEIILVVGDFAYDQVIRDPFAIGGANSGITSLAAHRSIMELARRRDREVWFDVHVWTDGPKPSPSMNALSSYVDAIDKLSDGAKHRVVVFEFNSGNHRQRRALANAHALGRIRRDGRIPIVTVANALQPDGHNDNGWDQGLLFLNPSKVWLQPPGYVARMVSRHDQPLVADVAVEGGEGTLDVTATKSEDGRTLVLAVVNIGTEPRPARLRLKGFAPSRPAATVEELAGPMDARNTADKPDEIIPRGFEWPHGWSGGAASYTFPPSSFTVLRFE